MNETQHQWPTWHNAERDGHTREQVIRAVYNLFARRKTDKPDIAGQLQQHKLPDFIRRLEESLYKMAASREEYADLNTLELRLQKVVHHIVRKPGGGGSRGTSQGEAGPSSDGGLAAQLAAGGMGAGDVLSPTSQSRQQQQQQAAVVAQMARFQQQQAAAAAAAAAGANGMAWMDGGGGMGLPQQQQQQQQQAPLAGGVGAAGGGGGNQLAVAGAPAGQSTAESAQRGNSGGIDFASLGMPGGDVTSGMTLPPASAGMQQVQQQRPASQQTQTGGGGAAAAAGGASAGLGGMPTLNPTFMSNGAPVLLRGAGAGGGGGGAASPLLGGLVPAGNGMVNLGSGSVGGGMMPTSQPPMQQVPGSMVPQIKIESGGGMVPVVGGSAGMMPLGSQQQQQQQQQHALQQQAQLGAGGMMGGYQGLFMPTSNGFGGSGSLMPGGQPGMLQPQHMLLQPPQPVLMQGQQAGAFGAGPGGAAGGAAGALGVLPPLMAQQAGGGIGGMGVGPDMKPPPLLAEQQQQQHAALPNFSLEADQSFNLLGPNAFPDLDGAMGGGSAAGAGGTVDDARKQQILKQQRWLLFLRHCARCQLGEVQCQYGRNCTVAKQLWQHLVHCKDAGCQYPRCSPSRELLRHHQKCTSSKCPVCAPVKQYVSKQRQLVFHRKTANLPPELRQNLLLHLQQNPKARELFQQRHGVDDSTIFATLDANSMAIAGGAAAAAAGGSSAMAAAAAAAPLPALVGGGAAGGMRGGPGTSAGLPLMGGAAGMAYGVPGGLPAQHAQQQGLVPAALGGYDAEGLAAAPKRQRNAKVLQENMGTSLLEYFTEFQIQTHVEKLRPQAPGQQVQVRGLPKATATNHLHMPQDGDSNCKVCELTRLTFEPPSLYCFGCGQRIKRNQVYYGTPPHHEIKGVWCHPCYQEMKSEMVPLEGFNIRKAELEKRKNDDEVEEGWVCCDQCEGWVHQICGLFNKGRNDQNRGFLCPFCLRDGLRTGERKVPKERPQAMLTARDLPVCDLSEQLEKRLEQVLQAERMQRAAQEGKHPSEVRTAEGLTVRVVNNVVKRNDVRSRLYNAVQGEGYPEAFMYKQKVILLFQNIDGVDLCLYCLYMQEYGEDAPPPNRKSVYLSYLDSVKYFQPEDVLAAGRGMALRTMVYHELLLGYLEYAKARGFQSMFIWACPPLAGDDYILYCHPFKQKTPRSDRLREWYHTMLKQAKEEKIVTYVSNMYDTYFEGGRDHRIDRPSITQLPYYDGDYWPGEAENLLASISSEGQAGGKGAASNKGSTSGSRSKPLKGKRVGPATGTTTEELLRRLGETIQGMREDFIVVHLQEPCSFCRDYISNSLRYYHPNPPQKVVLRSERTFDGINLDKPGSESSRTMTLTRFALCPKCYSAEIAGHGRGLPPGMHIGELLPAQCPLIPPTVDTVPEMENEFFDTRTAFLSLCQGNHYQFDSLRRAKHSSMMVLYHLHNPSAPAFSCTCNVCNKEIQSGEGWRCTTCSDFDMCNTCMLNPAIPRHEHQLVRHAATIDERRNRLTQDQLAARNQALHRTMQVLLHASECTDPKCPSTSCARVKAMYRHAMTCPVKLAGNCAYCRRMWMLLQMHATQCTVPNCQVPRCNQLRSIRRRQAARQEDKRRAAYRTMLRQQNA